MYCLVQTVFEVDKSVGRPELLAEFFSRSCFSGSLQQEQQKFEGLLAEFYFQAVLSQFTCPRTNLEDSKANGQDLARETHGAHLFHG